MGLTTPPTLKQPTWCTLPPEKFEAVASRVASPFPENILFTYRGALPSPHPAQMDGGAASDVDDAGTAIHVAVASRARPEPRGDWPGTEKLVDDNWDALEGSREATERGVWGTPGAVSAGRERLEVGDGGDTGLVGLPQVAGERFQRNLLAEDGVTRRHGASEEQHSAAQQLLSRARRRRA